MPTLEETEALIRACFSHRVDKAGHPYAEHCVRVMRGLPPDATDDERHAALLHDALENLPMRVAHLQDMDYSPRVIALVKALTRPRDMPYLDYVRQIRASDDAGLIAIKLADNADNADPARVALLPKSCGDLPARYAAARRILMGA